MEPVSEGLEWCVLIGGKLNWFLPSCVLLPCCLCCCSMNRQQTLVESNQEVKSAEISTIYASLRSHARTEAVQWCCGASTHSPLLQVFRSHLIKEPQSQALALQLSLLYHLEYVMFMLTALLDSLDSLRKVMVASVCSENMHLTPLADVKTSGRITSSRSHLCSLKLHFYTDEAKDRDVSPALVKSLPSSSLSLWCLIRYHRL